MNIEFEKLNNGWSPEPNAPEEEIVVSGSEQSHDGLNHYLLYLRDGTYECLAGDYELTL